MNALNSISNLTELTSLRHSVGKLAKSSVSNLKSNNDRALRVGSQEKVNPRTHTRTGTGDLKVYLAEHLQDVNAMTYLHSLLTNLLPELKVCYHNNLYVSQIQENYSEQESIFFLQWIRAFALLRRSDRKQFNGSVIITDEQDFLSAFRLMQQRKVAEYADLNPACKQKVLDLLNYKFQQRTFTAKILNQDLFYSYKLLNRIIMLLELEKQIEFLKNVGNHKVYRLRQKTAVNYAD